MKYISTRGIDNEGVSAAYAIKTGLAKDGGLYMPESIPTITESEISERAGLPYTERAAYVLSKFLTDYTYDELLADAEALAAEEQRRERICRTVTASAAASLILLLI